MARALELLTSDVGAFCSGQKEISAAAYRLLAWAALLHWGEPCPPVERKKNGKPYFRDACGRFFSVSHTGSRILIGLGEQDLGVDIERPRPLRPKLAERIYSPAMRERFSFLEAWTLREAVFKLTGQGSLMDMELSKTPDGSVITPFAGVICRTYYNLPDYVISAAAYAGPFPEKIKEVPPEKYLPSYALERETN